MADETFSRTIAGREIQFHKPTDAQVLMIGRLLRTSRAFTGKKEGELDSEQVRGGVERMSMILDIVDSMVVDPADRDWLEARIIDGTLDLDELMGAFGEKEDEPTNRATKRATARKAPTRASRS